MHSSKLFSITGSLVFTFASCLAYADGVTPLTFAVIKSTIIAPKCLQCHQGSNGEAGLDLSTYSSLVTNQLFVAGDPDKSDIFVQVNTGQMPFGGPKLSDGEIQMIHDWIQQGALEN
jgi:hypothetical protein